MKDKKHNSSTSGYYMDGMQMKCSSHLLTTKCNIIIVVVATYMFKLFSTVKLRILKQD